MAHQCLKCGLLFPEATTTILRGCPECRGTRFFFTKEPLTLSEREKLLKSSEVTLREAIEQLVAQAKDGVLTPKGVDWAQVGGAAAGDDVELIGAPAPAQRTNFSTILEKVAPAPAPHAPPATAPEPGPTGPPKARLLPGNRLLVQVARQPKRRARDVHWEYEAPPAPRASEPLPAPPAPVLSPAPTPVAPAPVQQTLPLVAPPPEVSVPAVVPHVAEDPGPAEGEPETIRIAQPGRYEIDVKRLLEDSPVVVQRDGTYLIHLPSLFDSANKQRK